jgi:hypothetical protein
MSMMGELTFFLGIQVKQMKQGTFVHQVKYTKDLMKKFNMAGLKLVSTPMSSTALLGPDEDGEAVDQREYRSMIDSLLYLTATRSDIHLAVGLCARFQARIGRYFSEFSDISNTHLSLGFGIVSSSLDLVGFSDADFVGCGIDRKSTSGTCHFLGSSLI